MTRYEIDPMRPESNIRVVNARSSQKDRPRSRLFNVWDDAKNDLLSIAAANVRQARLALDKAQGLQGNIKGMKPPRQNH